jgi:hypothetical protein
MATKTDPNAIPESPEALARIPEAIIGERNPRGIPSALFVVCKSKRRVAADVMIFIITLFRKMLKLS